jgi:magnesium chelatase subunit I
LKKIDHSSIATLGDLKKAGWKSQSVKEEIRTNLIQKIQSGVPLFKGIQGYEKTVIPQIINALLAKHDFILLGLRGQAKTKILRQLSSLLDEFIPVIEGTELREDPFHPQTSFAKNIVQEHGDKTPISWVPRSLRYAEKLATPDTNVSDLIGDIDPIKAASNKLSLSDEKAINFGLIPRANRGIFARNELPDLQPRIQVALLNIMQERDIQIRGFSLRVPVDVLMVFSANPEDYTNRGNIITPLKDRIDAQIITHYPKDREIGVCITQDQAWEMRGDIVKVKVPYAYREIVEQVAIEARQSEYIDQKSGVSARMSISAMEMVISAAESRAIKNAEKETTLRLTDLYHMTPALTGKLELVYEGEMEGPANVAKHLIGKAILNVFTHYFPDPSKKSKDKNKVSPYLKVQDWFSSGNRVDLHEYNTDEVYHKELNRVEGLNELISSHLNVPGVEATLFMDMALEAMHQHSLLSKTDLDQDVQYSDMMDSLLGGLSSSEQDIDEDLY